MIDEKSEKHHHTGKSLRLFFFFTWGRKKDLSAISEYLKDELVVWVLKSCNL